MNTNKISSPKKYQIRLYRSVNTPDIFFHLILKTIFHLEPFEIEYIVDKINENGSYIVANYIKEVASTKKYLVEKSAQFNKYSVKCEIELID